MTQILYSNQTIRITIPSGQRISISTASGFYNAYVVNGFYKDTVLATNSTTGAVFGPYLNGGAVVELSVSNNAIVSYDVGISPVITFKPDSQYSLDSNGDVNGFIAPDGSYIGLVSTSSLAADTGASLIGFKQSGTGAVPRTLDSKARNEVTPYDYGAVGNGIADDTVALNNFFAYLATTNISNAVCSGVFKVTGKITYSGTASSTKAITFAAKLNSTFTAEDEIFLVNGIPFLHFIGRLEINGQGSTTWTSRTNGHGLVVNNCTRFIADEVNVFYLKYDGVRVTGTTSQPQFGYIRAWYCGSGATSSPAVSPPALAFSAVANTGSSGSTSQRTNITVVSGSLDYVVVNKTFVKIGTTVHTVTGVDNISGTLTIYPWVENGITSGTMALFVGSGYYTSGVDTSAGSIQQLDTLVCGIGCQNQSLYPVSIGNHVTQLCGIGHSIGADISAAAVGGSTSYSYYEGNDVDIIQVTSSNIGYVFASTTALTKSRIIHIAPRLTGGTLSASFTSLSGMSIGIDGLIHQVRDGALSGGSPSTLSAKLIPTTTPVYTHRVNSGNINLLSNSENQRLFAINDMLIVIHGTGVNGSPTGALTFIPESGYSINGGVAGVSVVFSSFVGHTIFHAWLNGTNWELKPIGEQVLNGSATYDPPSLAASATATTTVTVTGAALGNFVEVAFDKNLSSLYLDAYVSAADTVTVNFTNPTVGVVDLASGTLRVRVKS